MKIEEFKNFVKNNPYLVKYVTNKKMTWQQFFEIYDLYGSDDKIWNDFKDNIEDNSTSNSSFVSTLKEIFGLVKGIDLNNVRKALTSLDKAIEAFKGINNSDNIGEAYQERPKNKYFED